MGTDNPQERRQTQATRQECRGKEWIEYMFECLGSHATAVVADFEADIFPLPQIGAQDSISQEFSICPEKRCGNANHPASFIEASEALIARFRRICLIWVVAPRIAVRPGRGCR